MGQKRGAHRVLVGKPERKDHYEDADINGRILLKWILKKYERGCGLDSWLALASTVMNLWVL
jgi:hypothetical protein